MFPDLCSSVYCENIRATSFYEKEVALTSLISTKLSTLTRARYEPIVARGHLHWKATQPLSYPQLVSRVSRAACPYNSAVVTADGVVPWNVVSRGQTCASRRPIHHRRLSVPSKREWSQTTSEEVNECPYIMGSLIPP